jgi:hypothetical protein
MGFAEDMASAEAALAGENIDVGKIKQYLKSMKSEHDALTERLGEVNTESKDRKLKLRELQKQIEDKDVQLSELEKKSDTTTLQTELTALKEFKAGVLKQQRESFVAAYGKIKDHPNFEKAKGFFVLPEADKDGKVLWDKLADDAMEKNIVELDRLQKLDYFAEVKPPQTHGNPFFSSPSKDGEAPTDRVGLEAVLAERFKKMR